MSLGFTRISRRSLAGEKGDPPGPRRVKTGLQRAAHCMAGTIQMVAAALVSASAAAFFFFSFFGGEEDNPHMTTPTLSRVFDYYFPLR